VAVIVNQQGGWFLYGNRLSNGDMLPHQRIRYMVGDSILYAHQELVDRNVTKNYVDGVKNRVNNLLRRLKSREVISGGACWLDNELNVAAIGTGQVYWDYDLGFYDIAERMTFRQHVTDQYNESIFE
jgi:phage tail sheath protein FI